MPLSTHTWNLKYNMNELIHETEEDSETWITDLWLSRGPGVREGGTGNLGLTDTNY